MDKVSKNSNKFLWVANAPSVDFVNTEIVQNGLTVDLLCNPQDLHDWLRESRLLEDPAAMRNVDFGGGLYAAKWYRATLRRGLEALAKGEQIPVATLAATNQLLERQVVVRELIRHGRRLRLSHRWRFSSGKDLCAPIAFSFAEFISTANLERIRKCANPACILFFYDTSKSSTRTWCSLDICGNKMRMAALRRRLRYE